MNRRNLQVIKSQTIEGNVRSEPDINGYPGRMGQMCLIQLQFYKRIIALGKHFKRSWVGRWASSTLLDGDIVVVVVIVKLVLYFCSIPINYML